MCTISLSKVPTAFVNVFQNKAFLTTKRTKLTVDGGMVETYQVHGAPLGLPVNNALYHQDRQSVLSLPTSVSES